MDINETIDNLLLALDLCGDGGPTPFTSEQYEEMRNFLEAQRPKEYGHSTWNAGTKPKWKVGDILAWYEYSSDHEGEHIIGEITNAEFYDEYQDWFYTFDNGTGDTEESLDSEECYTISRDYYDKHRKHR